MSNSTTEAFASFMRSLWLDLSKDWLDQTPYRVAKMFKEETCRGLFEKPPRLTVFQNDWNYSWPVLIKNISVKSLCEHHFQPFLWYAHICYIPWEKIIGLSKFSRIVDYFSRRPQVQERLTMQIFNYLKDILQTENIVVYIKSEHYCMKVRGVSEHQSETITQCFWWKFSNVEFASQNFWNLIKQ